MENQSNRTQSVAAVDLGSNSFHMIVARSEDGELQILDRLREMVRLGAALDAKNHLSAEGAEAALACLQRFGQRLRSLPDDSVRIVGTNTLRKAKSAQQFLIQAEQALGYPVEIISGIEEARLIYLGVSHSMDSDAERKLVVDIGGGSTEIIIGEKFESQLLESLYMGCVSMSQRYFRDGLITKERMTRATLEAQLQLEGIAKRYLAHGWHHAVGASGTAKAIAKVVQAQGWCSDGISFKALKKLRKALLSIEKIDEQSFKGLDKERVAVFPGGVAILYAIFQALKIEHMHISEWALREGLIYDLLGRIEQEDVRERTVSNLCKRYNTDTEHSEWVQKTAQHLLSQIQNDWALTKDHAQLLAWAAQLHEIGMAIAHSQFQKHGAYLVENSDMPGFSRQYQNTLAILIRSHRRKFPVNQIVELRTEQQQMILRLAILLRLAVLLQRGRGHTLPPVQLKVQNKGLQLMFASQWLEEHPLSKADLDQEQVYLESLPFSLEIVAT